MTDAVPESGRWFAKAAEDLVMARRAMDPAGPLPAMACYHAQQCVEKQLKGYLTFRNAPFRFVHDRVYLTQLCLELEPDFAGWLDAAEILGEYGTRVRYPSEENPEPDEEAAREAIWLAEQVKAFIDSKRGQEQQEKADEAPE
jgi:HEPN domain-containing protein